ncbi:MAG TPA: GAF domain-containing protein [Polyangiaceae bacterium]|jgi:hypothetical protein|nr:GAF domain-containing protein [Polyangiaceae bacterium]
MVNAKDTVGEYVRQVRESTQRYAKDLLAENEKLLSLAVAVHAEKVRLEEEVEALRSQIVRHREIERSLIGKMSDLETTRHELSARYVDVEQSNSNLANLYVASYGIHGSLNREDVVRAVHEVLVNIVGSEEFAIFERSADVGGFVLTSSMGLSPEECSRLRATGGRLGEALLHGAVYVREPEDNEAAPGEEHLTACVPLVVGASVRGAIAVFRLLSHKPALEPVDHEVFDLLATHAAKALYCSELHARVQEDQAAQ